MKDSTRLTTPSATPAIAQVLFDDVRIVVLSRAATEDEFEAHVREAKAMDHQVRAVLVVGDENSGMSAKARARLRDAGLLTKRTAVLMDSVIVRSIITALNWMGANVRGFRPDDLRQACAFLEIAPKRWAEFEQQVGALRRRAGVRPEGTKPDAEERPLVSHAEDLESQIALRVAKIRQQNGGRDG